MAGYKVPQDVEADDKLIGPFSFRQFIYLIIVALAGALAWGLAQVFVGLAIIPLPIILLFGALALPLRKDQPMEIYLAALISFYLKPHKRLWDPDGTESLIEITVPKMVEERLTKDITQDDADQRFGYLANIVDSQGWAIRGVDAPQSVTMNTDVLVEAQGVKDILDTTGTVGQSFNIMMDRETERVRQEAIERMRQVAATPTPPPAPQAAPVNDPATFALPATPVFNPYPTDIQQTVIQPVDDPVHQLAVPAAEPVTQTPPATSDNQVSADIINLANNTDFSIETIAHEAHRLEDKKDLSEETVISLR